MQSLGNPGYGGYGQSRAPTDDSSSSPTRDDYALPTAVRDATVRVHYLPVLSLRD